MADLIQRELSDLLRRDVRDPHVGMVTLTSVDVAPDLSHAKVFFTILDKEKQGHVSLYRGPLLLAYDQRFNSFDEAAIPPLDLHRLKAVTLADPGAADSELRPWLLLDLPEGGGRTLHLCDFASAGATGTRYRSWLPATRTPPAPPVTQVPADSASISTSKALFRWTKSGRDDPARYRLEIAGTNDFTRLEVEITDISSNRVVLTAAQLKPLAPERWHFWRVIASNSHGQTESIAPPARFRMEPTLPPYEEASNQTGPDGMLIDAPLRGEPRPKFGTLRSAVAFTAADGPDGQADPAVELDGVKGLLSYAVEEFPVEEYSVSVRVRLTAQPEGHLGQIFSAWAGPMDDPLRLCVDKGKLHARIEAGRGFSTEGVPIEVGEWRHIAAVKEGTTLTLYVDGAVRATASVPAEFHSAARDMALGGNPRYTGNEFLAARFTGFTFHARALSAREVSALSRRKNGL